MIDAPHIPVLINEVLRALAITPGSKIVDGTFGAGGYSTAFLEEGAEVHAFDRDPNAQSIGAELAGRYEDSLFFYPTRFSLLDQELLAAGIATVDAIVLDIGVSSMQIDEADRGFSFQKDGPLDMRMSQDGETAADFLNTAKEEDIANVIYQYGDEKRSRRVAKSIVAARPLETTGDLAHIVRKALGHRVGAPKDPSTRTFQAIRIHINGELDELQQAMDAAEKMLKVGGVLAIVTFHSIEDRIVKRFFKERSGANASVSRHMPVGANDGPEATFANVAKAVKPSKAELERNPRSRSAILRSAIRTDARAWAQDEVAA